MTIAELCHPIGTTCVLIPDSTPVKNRQVKRGIWDEHTFIYTAIYCILYYTRGAVGFTTTFPNIPHCNVFFFKRKLKNQGTFQIPRVL